MTRHIHPYSERILNYSQKRQAAEKAHFEAIVCAVFMFFMFWSQVLLVSSYAFFLESNSWQLTPKHLLSGLARESEQASQHCAEGQTMVSSQFKS